MKNKPREALVCATVQYAPWKPVWNGAHDAFGGRICFRRSAKKQKGNIANVIPGVGRMINVKKKNTQATPGQKKVSYIMLHTCWRWGIGYFNNGEG